MLKLEFLVIMSALSGFFATCIVLARIGRNWDSKEKRIRYINDKIGLLPYDELEQSIYKRFIYPKIEGLSKLLSKFGSRRKSSHDQNKQLENSLRMAGLKMSASEYSLVKLIFMTVMIVLSFVLAFSLSKDLMIIFWVISCGLISAILLPRYFLKSRITSRKEKIKIQLPEVIDLLSVSIQAGLGFDAALIRILGKMEGPLIDDLRILQREIQMGRPKREAFKNLGESSDIKELKTFSSAMIQADQLGIPVNNVLKVQSSQLRVARRQRAQEKGMKAPVKMMLPMVTCIFPVIFIILMGPTVIKLIDQFS